MSGSHFLFITHVQTIAIMLNLVIVIEFYRRLTIIELLPLSHSTNFWTSKSADIRMAQLNSNLTFVFDYLSVFTDIIEVSDQ